MGKVVAVIEENLEDESLVFEAVKVHNKFEIFIKNNYSDELYLSLYENEIEPTINALKLCLEYIKNQE